MIGDSHANAFIPGLKKAIRGKMAMASAAGPGFNFIWACDERFRLLEASVRPGDVVVIVQALRDGGETYYGPAQLNFFRWALVPMLQSRGAQLVMVKDWPRLRMSAVLCRPPSQTSNCAFTENELSTKRDGQLGGQVDTQRLNDLEDEFRGVVHVFDALELFMQDGRGSNLVPGTSTNAYADFDHLSIEGAEYLAPYICSAFERWGFFAPVTSTDWQAPTEGSWRTEVLASATNDDNWCQRTAVAYCVISNDDGETGVLPDEDHNKMTNMWFDRSCDDHNNYLEGWPCYKLNC